MKTSKIILIGFLSFVVLFLLSFLIQVDSENQKPQLEKKAIALPKFNHLVLLNSNNIKLHQAETDSAWVFFKVSSQAILPEFEMKSDTLVLNWAHNENNWNRTITCSGLESVIVEKSQLSIDNIAIDSLKLIADSGKIFLSTPNYSDYLQIELKQKSFIKVKGLRVKTIEAKANDSNVELWLEQIDKLKANLQNSSRLSTNKVISTNVESDTTSRYHSK